jgi:preprotein translocase subunit SecY
LGSEFSECLFDRRGLIWPRVSGPKMTGRKVLSTAEAKAGAPRMVAGTAARRATMWASYRKRVTTHSRLDNGVYMYVYIYVCVCVCVCWKETRRNFYSETANVLVH